MIVKVSDANSATVWNLVSTNNWENSIQPVNATNSVGNGAIVSGTDGGGVGLSLFNCSGILVRGNTIHGHSLGLQFKRTKATITVTANEEI